MSILPEHHHNERVWLNSDGSYSTGSVVAFLGRVNWGKGNGESDEAYLEVADCRGKVKLHRAGHDTLEDFEQKMRTLAAVALRLADKCAAARASVEVE